MVAWSPTVSLHASGFQPELVGQPRYVRSTGRPPPPRLAHGSSATVELRHLPSIKMNSVTLHLWQNVNQAASPLIRCVSVVHTSSWLCECRVETQHQELKRGRGVSRAPMEPNNPLGRSNSTSSHTSSRDLHSVRLRHTRFSFTRYPSLQLD